MKYTRTIYIRRYSNRLVQVSVDIYKSIPEYLLNACNRGNEMYVYLHLCKPRCNTLLHTQILGGVQTCHTVYDIVTAELMTAENEKNTI